MGDCLQADEPSRRLRPRRLKGPPKG